ncbi:MAG: acyl-CoA carboxylase subunit epsilon [Catenulispora sp.]|nr:acyl-CoA carboxylase subunit epsilon [Catenulispora sp.]
MSEGAQIRVVHGNPTDEEIAAVVTVLAAASVAATQSRSDNDQRGTGVRSGWTARERGVRTPLRPGPGGWRASAFPPAH